MKKVCLLITIALISCASGLFAQADLQETIGMIKKNLADSREKIKNYEWIETTTTFMDGEQKSLKQNQCYYSVDGKLTKVETGATTKEKTPGGLRGKIIANKKAELSDYMKKAIAKIQTYLPPNPDKIQKIYADGKVSIQVLEPGKKFKLSFPDYSEPGDLLALSIDKVNQKIIGASVSTSVDDPKEKVVFNINYNNLPDGTQYAGNTTLDAQAKKLKIVIENSGFKKAAGH
ncbi:MAG: hypothetical protein WCO44_07875 [Bacteroidota bacterium]